ncbi:MAG: hypothetical protein RLY43_2546 [Bacteroidota bacterium]
MNDLPLRFVIFGGTGDLVRKKIIPAIFNLYKEGLLQENFQILGISRKSLSSEDFRNWIKENSDIEDDIFLKKLSYFSADISDRDSLKDLVLELNKEAGNNLYYLAISPNLYENAFNNIATSGLMNPQNGWDRVLIEKPFGNDLGHAKKLDILLGKLFKEDQIFRIDHYLAKETLQNIITFRFANYIFEPSWNSNFIDEVHIKMYESYDVDNRAAFYDSVGALKDVGQNHILQMLALITMEEPKNLDFESIRKSRAEVLENLDFENKFVRGQYSGYEKIQGVKEKSQTETLFSITAKINNFRWQNTKFYLISGKALKETKTEIKVLFKEKGDGVRNVITFKIQPEQKIIVEFWYKENGFDYKVRSKELIFDYDKNTRTPDAYEKVLFDAIKGDQTLFISTEEILSQWDFIEKIIKSWQNTPIFQYEKGIDPEEKLSTI